MLPSSSASRSLVGEGGREGSYVHPTTFKAARGARQIELERRRRRLRRKEGGWRGEEQQTFGFPAPSLPQYSRWGKCETDTRAHSAFSQAGKKWGGRWAGRAAILGRCFLGRISINQVRMETHASLEPKIMGKPARANTDQGNLECLL